MAAPPVRGVGASGVGTETCTAAVPTGGNAPQSGDAMYILLEYIGATTSDTTTATASGWTPLFDNFYGTGTNNATHMTVLGKIAGASEADVTVTNVTAGNHISAQMIVVYDHGLATIDDTVVGTVLNGTGTTSPETHDITGITVTADSLVLLCLTNGTDANSTAYAAGWANANLASITERMDRVYNTGSGGGIGMATGTCAGTSTGTSTVDITFGTVKSWQTAHLGIPPVATGTPANVTPTTVTASSTVPSSSVAALRIAAPTPAAAVGSGAVPQVGVSTAADAAVTAGPTTGAGSVPQATAEAVRIADVTPAVVTATASVPTPSVAAGEVENADVTPATVTAAVSNPAPAVVGNANAPPGAVAATAAVPAVTVSTGLDAAVVFLDPPNNLTATPISSTEIDLAWDAVAGAATYHVERDGATIQTGLTDTSYPDTGLDPSTSYGYRVKAFGSPYVSEYSVLTGQSYVRAANGTPALTTTALYPGYATELFGSLSAPSPGEPVDLREGHGIDCALNAQRPSSTLGWGVYEGLPASTRLVLATYGEGGASIDECYGYIADEHLARIEDHVAWVAGSVRLIAVHYMQGEAEPSLNPDTYYAALLTVYNRYQVDGRALTGQAENMIGMFQDQCCQWDELGTNLRRIAKAQLRAHREYAWHYLVGPRYHLPYHTDGLHLTNVGYYKLGEYHAKAHVSVRDGNGWEPVAPSSITRSGTTVTAVFNVPVAPLVFDTTQYPAVTNMGFKWHDSSDPLATPTLTITDVDIVADDTLEFVLSGTPSAQEYLSYGYIDRGGNLRDSDPAVSGYDAGPLHNWCAHFYDQVGA